jgi:hypothetical protein
MTKALFLEEHGRYITIVGEFKNKSDELFLIYYHIAQPGVYFITGDDMDWDETYQVDRKIKHFVKMFITNRDEYKKAQSLINNFEESSVSGTLN